MLTDQQVEGGDTAAEDLKAEQLPAKVTLMRGAKDEEGQIDQIHIGGNGDQLVPTQVVLRQPMSGTRVESK